MSEPTQAVSPAPTKKPRLGSLDAMRGLVIALMFLVNMTWDREHLHPQLFHVGWNDPAQGATVTDLVFPWFVFMMGASIPFSVRSGRGRGKSAGAILAAAALRGAKLYLLGTLLTVASFAHKKPLTWECLMYWNILQLLGTAYFVAVAAWLLPGKWKIAFVAAALMLKWGTFMLPWDTVTQWVKPRPPEGAPSGPGTWAHFDAVKQLLHMEFVPVATLRSHLIGWFGMSQQFVPLAAIAVVGGMASDGLSRGGDDREGENLRRVGRVAALSLVLMAMSVVLQWGYRPEGDGLWGAWTVPYSKWFFSPAYCLLAAGSGALLLAIHFAVIDAQKWCSAYILQAMGKNALALYFGAELSFKLIFSKWLIPLPDGGEGSIAAGVQAWIRYTTESPVAASLGWAVLWVAMWAAVAVWLDRRGLYWRV